MKLRYLYIIMCVFGLLVLAGCREDAVLPDGQGDAQGKTLLVLDFTIEGRGTASRAVDDDSPEHPAADWEDNIAFFHVFIKHADGTWEDPIIFSAVNDALRYEIELDQADLTGETIYLGANLTTSQAVAFMEQQQAKDRNEAMPPYAFTENSFSLVTDFSPYSTFDERNDRNHIAMFCTAGATPVLTDAASNAYAVSFSLKRMVAKVLVTCEIDENAAGGTDGQRYVPITSGANSDFKGWIRQTEVKYLVNGLNRQTYIMQQIDGTATDAYANVIDPNNELSQSASAGGFFFRQIEGGQDNGFFRTSLPFDAGRLSVTNTDYTGNRPYTEGIYCPENTFASSDITLEGEQAQVTHVNVAARFTPSSLYVEDGLLDYVRENYPRELPNDLTQENDGKVECPTEAVASRLLSASLEMAANRNGFPERTYFYHYTDKTFHTYGAMVAALGHQVTMGDLTTNPGTLGEFVPYIDGWGYYYTYVDNRLDNYGKQADTDAYRYGQVERNRYYILNITGFTRPGSSVTNPEYILVHTYSFPWKDGGSGSIELNPEDEVRE